MGLEAPHGITPGQELLTGGIVAEGRKGVGTVGFYGVHIISWIGSRSEPYINGSAVRWAGSFASLRRHNPDQVLRVFLSLEIFSIETPLAKFGISVGWERGESKQLQLP